ncbi:MAG: GC-type dockerin domain-anchored protein [Phycisphaerales bacterium]
MRTNRLAAMVALGAVACGASVSNAAIVAFEGMWFNDTFGSSGPMTMLLTFSPPDVTVYVDLGGNVFGGSDPDPFTATGTIDANNDVVLSGSNPPLYTSISGTITHDGDISVDLSGGGGVFPLVEIRGTWTATESNSTYKIYANPGPALFAQGRIELVADCVADLDNNGVLNLDDIAAFAGAFINGDDAADLNKDGVLNLDDIANFVRRVSSRVALRERSARAGASTPRFPIESRGIREVGIREGGSVGGAWEAPGRGRPACVRRSPALRQSCSQTARRLPPGSVNSNRRPPGKLKMSLTITPPASRTASRVASSRSPEKRTTRGPGPMAAGGDAAGQAAVVEAGVVVAV